MMYQWHVIYNDENYKQANCGNSIKWNVTQPLNIKS